MVLSTAALCLGLAIYHEARGESFEGQHAVAQVIMNRAGRDPANICREVFKPGQFSWTNPLTRASKQERANLVEKYMPKDEKAWLLARSIAYYAANGTIKDFTHGATFYHATSVSPIWRHDFKLVAVIGNHKFYRV